MLEGHAYKLPMPYREPFEKALDLCDNPLLIAKSIHKGENKYTKEDYEDSYKAAKLSVVDMDAMFRSKYGESLADMMLLAAMRFRDMGNEFDEDGYMSEKFMDVARSIWVGLGFLKHGQMLYRVFLGYILLIETLRVTNEAWHMMNKK